MNRNKSVAIVGHSLVPHSIGNVHGATVEIYRSPGSKVASFESNEVLSKVLHMPHDLTILFIGGNDIHDECVPATIAHDIISTAEQIHHHCQSHIALVLVEHRNPIPGNRFNVTASKYRRIANNINNRLKNKLKSKSYVQFLSIGAKPFQYGVARDGVHLNKGSELHLQHKFRNTIKYFLDKFE